MNSLHDAVQSRNGPAEAAANGERNGDVGLALLCRVRLRLRPPATRTVIDISDMRTILGKLNSLFNIK